jgi:3-methyladenine DNA glycosylase/8-oxoguanine DNA glycosylase
MRRKWSFGASGWPAKSRSQLALRRPEGWNIDAAAPGSLHSRAQPGRRRSQVVRQRSAKPSFVGSTPTVASISTPPGFAFTATVESHGWYRLAPFRWSKQEGVLRRAELLGGKPVELAIRHRDGALLVDHVVTPELQAKLARMFQLDVDLSEFLSLCRTSPGHAWVARSGFGRLLCGATLFEDIVKIIATTNVTWSQTVKMTALLVDKCGRRTPAGNAAFPEPEEVASVSVDDLQRDCRLGYRAKTIHALASGIISGEIDLVSLADPSQTTAELFESYRRLPGIGPYGAAHLLAMDGRHDFIAVDTEFRRFVRDTYHRGRKVADATMLRRYAKWGRWKYLAYWSELWSEVREPERRDE